MRCPRGQAAGAVLKADAVGPAAWAVSDTFALDLAHGCGDTGKKTVIVLCN